MLVQQMPSLVFFALNEDIAKLEFGLPGLEGQDRLTCLVRLAWYVRQQDSRRALALSDEAQALLALLDVPELEGRRELARLALIRGEVLWLLADLDAAQSLAESALQSFEELQDYVGIGDAHCLLASVTGERSDSAGRNRRLELAIAALQLAGDSGRLGHAWARVLTYEGFVDARRADARLTELFDAEQDCPVAVVAWLACAQAVVAAHTGDFGLAVKRYLQAYDAAFQTSQVRQVIVAACNAADAFASLGDLDAALEWDERALSQSRGTGWPSMTGFALTQTGHVLRLLGRYTDAKAVLSEALGTMDVLLSSRTYTLALQYLGDLSLDMGDLVGAVEYFSRAQARAASLEEPIFVLRCWIGHAHALSRMALPQEAFAKAAAALALAQSEGCLDEQVRALRVHAELCLQHGLPQDGGLTQPQAALQYLQHALAVAAGIEGFAVPSELLDEASNAHAACGDYRLAYDFAKKAAVARDSKQLEEARKRAVAMQVRMETERIRAEGERHRQMAQTQAQRAAVLQDANATLETLGQIGRDITASLNADDVFGALERHVSHLLAVTSLDVYLLESDGRTLRGVFGVEDGAPSPLVQVDIGDLSSVTARCARERSEIAVQMDPAAPRPNLVPGTRKTMSLLFAPLLISDRLLGVLTVQSVLENAYGERERLVFRTLCAYGAIALDNANAYRQLEATLKTLRKAQEQLEEATITDPLTGLRNRRFLLQHIESETALVMRRHEHAGDAQHQAPDSRMDLVFFMVDLDHFKSVNDTFGHACGDMVLVQMRERLQEVFRASDYLVRWGGEEFLLVARATNRAEAALIAERVRMAVSSRPFELAGNVKLDKTCSIGFACFPFAPGLPRLLSWAQVVELADQALYLAKHSGRNTWFGLYAADHIAQPEDYVKRVVADAASAAQAGELRLVSRNGTPRAALRIEGCDLLSTQAKP